MAFARIMEDRSISRSHRYTMEDSEISISLVMETFNDEPSMYLIVSYPLDSFLKTEDLFYHSALRRETEMEIEGVFAVHLMGFAEPALNTNTDANVFSVTLAFVVNELHRLSQLNEMRKTIHKPQ